MVGGVGIVGDRLAVARDQEELGLDAGLDAQPGLGGFGDQPLQHARAGAWAIGLSSMVQSAATQATSFARAAG